MLYIVGLGLGDERDITLRGLDAVRKCARVYLEAYTSTLLVGTEKLEALYGRPVIVADRYAVEQEADAILEGADTEDVAFLVVGDPFGATTHSDLQLRAHQKGVPIRVVPNASVLTAVGACGLQLYRFGETVTIVFFTPSWRPDSFYDRIAANRSLGLHTLCLLDIRVKEPTAEALCRGRRDVFEPPRFMSAAHAAQELLEVAASKPQPAAYGPSTLAVGVARLGTDEQRIAVCTLEELTRVDLGAPLHSLIIPGECHPLEAELMELWRVVPGAAAVQPGPPPPGANEAAASAADDDDDDDD